MQLVAQQIDSRPPFWWVGLFASPGGLLIIGITAIVVVVLLIAPLMRGSARP